MRNERKKMKEKRAKMKEKRARDERKKSQVNFEAYTAFTLKLKLF